MVSLALNSRLIGSIRILMSCRSIRLIAATTHRMSSTNRRFAGSHELVADSVSGVMLGDEFTHGRSEQVVFVARDHVGRALDREPLCLRYQLHQMLDALAVDHFAVGAAHQQGRYADCACRSFHARKHSPVCPLLRAGMEGGIPMPVKATIASAAQIIFETLARFRTFAMRQVTCDGRGRLVDARKAAGA